MMKLTRLLALALLVFASTAMSALAQGDPPRPGTNAVVAVPAAPFYGRAIGAGIGAGIVLIGAGIGFGKIGAAALESMSRQPEVADKVSGSMVTIAALLEGATFFALIVCLLVVFVAV